MELDEKRGLYTSLWIHTHTRDGTKKVYLAYPRSGSSHGNSTALSRWDLFRQKEGLLRQRHGCERQSMNRHGTYPIIRELWSP